MDKAALSQFIKSEAHGLGFAVCGITRAEAVAPDEVKRYTYWVKNGNNGTMQYLERNCDKRFDPTALVEGCKSIVLVALNYAPQRAVEGISNYAQGKDYHKVVKERLYTLLKKINEKTDIKGRAFCDSAPVLERYWAVQAGLGWIGRNRQLIIPGKGSQFFIGELLIDRELEYDTPFTANHCGNCTQCIDNCPTGALCKEGFDARKCLSYLTIEYRGEKLPENSGEKMKNCFYGCDCCQAACPHNRFSTPTEIEDLQPRPELLQMTKERWSGLTAVEYDRLFAESAVERCGYRQLMRNIKELYTLKEQ